MKGAREKHRDDAEDLREKIIGLGEKSFRKSYYPELQEKLADLERFKTLIDQSNDAIFLIEVPSGHFIHVSKSACRQTGFPEGVCSSKTLYDLLPDNRRELSEIFSGKTESLALDTSLLKANGEISPYEVDMRRVSSGSKAYVVAIARDITERKRAENELRESEEKFRALAESSPAAIFVYQEDRYISVNKASEKITGYSKDELLKQRITDIIHRDFKEQVLKHALGRQRGEPEPGMYETKIVTKGGEVRWILLAATRIMYQGKPAGVATLFDITERKRTEKALLDAKAQAELYLDLMSHDITNMNQALMGYLEVMETERGSGEIEKGLIDNSMEIINRSSRMISDVKKLTKLQAGKVLQRDVDVCEMLAEIKAEYWRVPGRRITINYTPGKACVVRADDLLKDALENLVDNAIRHSIGPLTINLGIDRVTIDDRLYYRVTVSDTGPGIPDDLKKKIFTTLKEAVEKTERRGFGLYFVKTVIDHYHGKVWVEDRVPGDYRKGSKFVVQLPASAVRDTQSATATAGT